MELEAITTEQREISRIASLLSSRATRYLRNLNRYQNSRMVTQNLTALYDIVPTMLFYPTQENGYSNFITYNVTKSIIDTVTSKISQNRVRPYFNSVDGSFKTRKVCQSAQKFFDVYFDNQNVYQWAPMCARDAMIFDYGVAWIDDDTFSLRKISPFEFYVDPYEYKAECVSRCYVCFDNYPVSGLDKYFPKKIVDKHEDEKLCKLVISYNLKDKHKYYFINGECEHDKKITFTAMPFELLYWNDSVKGFFSNSIADDVVVIQNKLDMLEDIISEAWNNSIKHTYLSPRRSGIKASKLSNKIAQFVDYDDVGNGMPIQIIAPPAIDNQYLKLKDKYIQEAFEMVGLSQLSAQSKKPKNTPTNEALETLQDVESERFNIFLHNYIDFQTNISKKCIDIFPPDAEIIKDNRIHNIKWADLIESRDMYQVQFSGLDFISKDPSRKREEIQWLVANGYLDGKAASRFIGIPDSESAYSMSTVSSDYCEKIIENAIMRGDMNYEPFVNLMELMKIISYYIQRGKINGAPQQEIETLEKLFASAKAKSDEAQQSVSTPPAPAPIPPVSIGIGDLREGERSQYLGKVGIEAQPVQPPANILPVGAVAPGAAA